MGEEVPQLYLHDAFSSVIKPYKELAGFTRISLEPGESRRVSFEVGNGRCGHSTGPGNGWWSRDVSR